MRKLPGTLILFLFTGLNCFSQQTAQSENIVLITFDGYRWQEPVDILLPKK